MYDTGKVIGGLVVFLILATSPLIFNAMSSTSAEPPELVPPPNGTQQCVMPTEWMRSSHMNLLDQWREDAVRRGDRDFVIEATGETVTKSLTLTCMDCHSNKSEFCDRCHDYLEVAPYCWDCHVAPVEGKEVR